MCGIFASDNLDLFFELGKLNSKRGSAGFSITGIDVTRNGEFHVGLITRKTGNFYIPFKERHFQYYIGHIQAPTATSFDISRTHPSVLKDSLLWHNGTLLRRYFEKLGDWDTEVLHRNVQNDFSDLDSVEGQYACLLIRNNSLYAFRNSESPLFIDRLNISSVQDENMKSLPDSYVYNLDFHSKMWVSELKFDPKSSTYFF